MSAAREKVIFLHLHKTGGLSANTVLQRQFIGQRGAVIHRDVKEKTRELLAMPPAERDQLAYITGHVYYGIHEVWSSPAGYFTFLREPVARTVSNYSFLGVVPRGLADPAFRGEFEAYLRNPANAAYMVKRIAGYKPGQPGVRFEDGDISTRELLAMAESHLRQMKVVGLTERFDTTLLLLRRAFGWRNIYYVRRNTTAEKGKTEALGPALRDELRDLYAPDLALYETAKAVFDAQCRAYGDTLDADLARFRKNNALYSRVFAATERIRSTALYGFFRRMIGGLLRG